MPTLTGCGASLLRTPPLLFPFYYHESRVMLWESGILPIQTSNTTTLLAITPSVSNYRSFELFDLKFDHSSYSKICAKYHFFCCGLLYQYKFFKNDLNLTIFVQFFCHKFLSFHHSIYNSYCLQTITFKNIFLKINYDILSQEYIFS